MKIFLLLFSRINVFVGFGFVFAASVNAQQTVIVPSNKSGNVTVAQSALPVLTDEPFETKTKSQAASRGGKFSVLTEKPSGNLFGEQKTFFCSTPNTHQRPRGKFDIKAVGALDCGIRSNLPCYWTKPYILVGFINGTSELKQLVRDVLAEWTVWANVAFIVNDNSYYNGDQADIKILFNANDVHNSFVGIDAWHSSVRTGKDAPTMNLGFLNARLRAPTGEVLPYVKGTILHEFGHALGLQHEHQHPAGGIQWNREAVIKDLTAPSINWSVETIERNIFQALSRSRTQFTQYDPSSVMHYPFPARWTLNNVSIPENNDLSETDKRFIAEVYPRKRTALNSNQYYRLTTWYSSGKDCLSIAYEDASGGRRYFPYLTACDKTSNAQLWKFTPVGAGSTDYRVTNYLTGAELALDDVGLEYYTELKKSGNYSGQHWAINGLGKFNRLTSKYNGNLYSFTSNTAPNTRLYLSKTGHWSNQLWEFIPTVSAR